MFQKNKPWIIALIVMAVLFLGGTLTVSLLGPENKEIKARSAAISGAVTAADTAKVIGWLQTFLFIIIIAVPITATAYMRKWMSRKKADAVIDKLMEYDLPEELIEYIQQKLAENTPRKTIRRSLVKRGYPEEKIDNALEYVETISESITTPEAHIEEKPKDKSMELPDELIEYIQLLLKRHISYKVIEKNLLKTGWPEKIIDFAIDYTKKKNGPNS